MKRANVIRAQGERLPLDLLAPLLQLMQREASVPVHEPLHGTHATEPSLPRKGAHSW